MESPKIWAKIATSTAHGVSSEVQTDGSLSEGRQLEIQVIILRVERGRTLPSVMIRITFD